MLVVVSAGEAFGCPTCKDGVAESDPEGMNLARGYFYSILLMLSMPFALAGSFGCYVWREMRRQRRAEREDRGGSAPRHGARNCRGVNGLPARGDEDHISAVEQRLHIPGEHRHPLHAGFKGRYRTL